MAPKTEKPKKPVKGVEKTIKKKKKNYTSYSTYLYKVLRSSSEDDMGISRQSMLIMNNFINDIMERILREASVLVKRSNKRTLTSHDIQSAVRLVIPGELGTHATLEGIKALSNYRDSTHT